MVVENFEAVSLLDVVVSRFVAEGGQPKNLDKTNRSNLRRAFNILCSHNREDPPTRAGEISKFFEYRPSNPLNG